MTVRSWSFSSVVCSVVCRRQSHQHWLHEIPSSFSREWIIVITKCHDLSSHPEFESSSYFVSCHSKFSPKLRRYHDICSLCLWLSEWMTVCNNSSLLNLGWNLFTPFLHTQLFINGCWKSLTFSIRTANPGKLGMCLYHLFFVLPV